MNDTIDTTDVVRHLDAATDLIGRWAASGQPAALFFTGSALDTLVGVLVDLTTSAADLVEAVADSRLDHELAGLASTGLVERVDQVGGAVGYQLTQAGRELARGLGR